MEVANDQKKRGTKNDQELKHLALLRTIAIKMLVCLSNLYDHAKMNSGPLKSTVGTVEGVVTTVVGPVYDKFKGVPDHVLVFLDQKVDLATVKFDEHAPSIAKQIACHVCFMTKVTSHKAQDMVHLGKVGGPSAAFHYAAREFKNFLLCVIVMMWSKLDQIEPFHIVSETLVSTGAHWSEKYNKAVINSREKGYLVVAYLPLVPIDDIARVFKQASANQGKPAHEHAK